MKPCKQCREEKELSEFYSHPLTADGRLSRCKECVKAWRRSEKERAMARVIDSARTKTQKRKRHVLENTRKFRTRNPEKWKAQQCVNNFFRKFPDKKPVKSSVSGLEWRLHMHHRDYSKPLEIIPCTPLEHCAFHSGKIQELDEYVVILSTNA